MFADEERNTIFVEGPMSAEDTRLASIHTSFTCTLTKSALIISLVYTQAPISDSRRRHMARRPMYWPLKCTSTRSATIASDRDTILKYAF